MRVTVGVQSPFIPGCTLAEGRARVARRLVVGGG